MKIIKAVERIDNNYRIRITVDNIDKSIKVNSVISINDIPRSDTDVSGRRV